MLFKSFSFFIAKRYLLPTRRTRFVSFITAVAVLGIMFGTAALLISFSILQGFDETLRSTMISFMGHIEVTGFKNRPVEGYRDVVATLPERTPEVRDVSPFIRQEAIVRSRAGLEGVLVKGVMPDIDVSTVADQIVAGAFAFPKEADLPSIVLGERLANKLRVGLADSVVIFIVKGIPGPNNPPVIEQFRVGGVYRSGMAEYDDIYVYTSLAKAQELSGLDTSMVSGYDILVHDIETVNATARKLDTALGYPHFPRTLFDIHQSLFAWLDLQRGPILYVIGLIIIVASFNIISTLLMVVLEKTESIGVLATIGAQPKGIMSVFIGQGVLISGLGTLLGAGLSLGFTLAQQHYKIISLDPEIYVIDAVPVSLNLEHYALVIGIALVLAFLSTIIPAYIAARLRPVQALRFR